jgi:hypothetical protein
MAHPTGGAPGGDTTGGDLFGDLELAANALESCRRKWGRANGFRLGRAL